MNFIPLFNPKDFSVSNDTVRIINPLPFLRGNHLFVPDHVQMPDGTVLPCDWFAYITDLSLPLCDIEEPITMHVGQNFIDLLENHVNGWVNADQLLSRTTFPSLESIVIEVECEHFKCENGIVLHNDSFLIIPPLNNSAQTFPLIDVTIREETNEGETCIDGKQDVFGGVYSNDGKVFLQLRRNVNTVSYVMRPGVEEIADYAFWKLTAIGLGESGRTFLSKVILPEGLKKIGKHAFDSSGLRHINLPDSLKEIGYAAFAGCTQLALGTLPANLRRIGTAAFFNTAISTITIPKNVIHIGRRVFNMCIRLERINVASENKHYTSVDGILYSKDMTQLIAFPYLQKYQLYDHEAHKGEEIEQSIGEPCTQLTLPTFHTGGIASNTMVVNNLKAGYDGNLIIEELRTIDAPLEDGSVKKVVVSRMAEMRLEDPNTGMVLQQASISYGSKLFAESGTTIKKGEVIAEWDPFNAIIVCEQSGRVAYRDVVEGNTYKVEMDDATGFEDKIVIESKDRTVAPIIDIVSPDGDILASYTLPLGAHIMLDDDEEVKPGAIVAKINRTSSKAGVITGGNRQILVHDHYWGIPRKEYVMPDSVLRIENSTFSYAQFETLSLGGGLHSIECGNFNGCKIDKLIIGRNITKIASDAFKRYSSHGIKNIEVSEDNEYFCSQKGILYNKEKTSLLRCPSQYTGTISIPNTVTTICKNALAEINVQELQIPDSVTRIEANAFEGSKIVVLYLSRNLTYIAQRAFDYCDTLTTVYVSSKMKKTVERILSRRKSYKWIPKVEILIYDK